MRSSFHNPGRNVSREVDPKFTKNWQIDMQQLMLASYHGHADFVSLLITHGADPNSLNDKGQSPLAGAVFKGEDKVVKVTGAQ